MEEVMCEWDLFDIGRLRLRIFFLRPPSDDPFDEQRDLDRDLDLDFVEDLEVDRLFFFFFSFLPLDRERLDWRLSFVLEIDWMRAFWIYCFLRSFSYV